MTIDGKAIAADIYQTIKIELSNRVRKPRLCVLTSAPNAETRKYLDLKKRKAEELGIHINVIEFIDGISTEEFIQSLQPASRNTDGIVVQLPLPAAIDTDDVLAAIPAALDVDMVNSEDLTTEILPPVVGAVAEIAKRHNVEFTGKQVVVVGEGRLVGKPAALWAAGQGADVKVIDEDTINAEEVLKSADIIISGAGVTGLITPDKVKEEVIIFDAGTSEEGGILKGDADPACADKAALFTPVPGGIGPITIAVLLRNLVKLSSN